MMRAAAAFPKDLFAGRSVFVTGGGSGINLGIATAFVELGAGVGICGRNPERLEGARELLVVAAGGDASRVVTAVADVRDYDAVEAALAKTEAGLGAPVSTLVAGAAGNFMGAWCVCETRRRTPWRWRAVWGCGVL